MPSIKKIYVEDFGALETEALKIDYLRLNLKSDLSDNEIATLATYFRRIGFSSYKKKLDTSKERSKIFTDEDFVVTFVLSTPLLQRDPFRVRRKVGKAAVCSA